jgi:hypothetical protein
VIQSTYHVPAVKALFGNDGALPDNMSRRPLVALGTKKRWYIFSCFRWHFSTRPAEPDSKIGRAFLPFITSISPAGGTRFDKWPCAFSFPRNAFLHPTCETRLGLQPFQQDGQTPVDNFLQSSWIVFVSKRCRRILIWLCRRTIVVCKGKAPLG